MKVRILSNSNLNANNATTFQGRYTDFGRVRDAIDLSKGRMRVSDSDRAGTINHKRAGEIIKTLLNLASGHPIVKKYSFEIECIRGVLANTTKILGTKSKASIEQKKAAVDAVFALEDKEKALDSVVVNGYITDRLIPRIVKTNDKELAEHTLNLLKRPTEDTLAVCNLVLNRIDLINVTKDSKYLHELEGYTGDQFGLPLYMRERQGYHLDKLTIEEEADRAIDEILKP